MRILHVISGLSTGGAEAVLYRLVTGPTAVEHEVICLEGRDFYSGELEEHGVRVHHVDWSSIGSLKAAFRLHRLIRSIDADLVQTWMYRPNFFGGISSRLVGKPVVWNIRCSTFNSYPAATQALAYLGGFLARWIPKFVINCSAESRRLHARIGYDAVEGAVIPNGYDPDVFKPDEARRAQTREALGIPPGSFVIGTIGRWHPQKGLADLLAAMRIVHERGVPARLLLVGRGLDRDNRELGELIRKNECGDLVELVGERTDIPDVARALDLHVLASIAGEGFPNAVAETMLSGTPSVVTDIGDAAAIVGETGWVVPAGDPALLADAIAAAYTEWATSPDRWSQRRAAARKRLAENFPLQQMIDAYHGVWTRVIGTLDLPFDKVKSRVEVSNGV